MHQIRFRLGPLGGAYSAPQTPWLDLTGPYFWERGEGVGEEGKGKGGVKGGEGKGRDWGEGDGRERRVGGEKGSGLSHQSKSTKICPAVMQERVYEKRVNDIDELCQRLLSVWYSIGQNVIDEAIDQWRARLTACVRAKGRHFEHLM